MVEVNLVVAVVEERGSGLIVGADVDDFSLIVSPDVMPADVNNFAVVLLFLVVNIEAVYEVVSFDKLNKLLILISMNY